MDGSGYYLDLWRYRKMYFLIPALLVAVIAVVLAFKLPPIYQSTSTILIEEQQIPPEFVRATVTCFADHHIQILNQQILSRSRLQEIVDKFNLYAEMRQKSTREEIIDKMRKDIEFKTISAKVHDKKRGPADTVTIAFTISYQGKSPTTVQQVAGTLATLYL